MTTIITTDASILIPEVEQQMVRFKAEILKRFLPGMPGERSIWLVVSLMIALRLGRAQLQQLSDGEPLMNACRRLLVFSWPGLVLLLTSKFEVVAMANQE